MKCYNCKNYLFFKPIPDDTFVCCSGYGESVKDINLYSGMSPAIEKYYCFESERCKKFRRGKSSCSPPHSKPFNIPDIRIAGEAILIKLLLDVSKSRKKEVEIMEKAESIDNIDAVAKVMSFSVHNVVWPSGKTSGSGKVYHIVAPHTKEKPSQIIIQEYE
ncbi:MAG: hypothetical protein AAB696_01845 [Patescibacteria group bacterium]